MCTCMRTLTGMTEAPDSEDDALLTTLEAASKLRISRRKLMEFIASGEIATIRIPSKNGVSRGDHRIEPAEIKRFIDRNRQRASA